MVPHLLRRYFSKEARSKLKCLDILENDLGRSASRRRNECCDKNGLPLPWYTYPALEYLEQINWSGASQSIANTTMTTVDATRNIKLYCGGSGASAHAIIDIVGYFL